MDIDLLFTEDFRAGLICNQNLVKKAAGVLMDTATGLMTIEYADMDFLELNIPIDRDFFTALENNPQVQIGAVKDGNIAQAYQVPLMFLDDPYRGEKMGGARQSRNPLLEFEYFIKNAISGQPAHRDDLSDDGSMGCVLGDAVPSSLQFAPHLARQQSLEAAPSAMPSLNLGPSAPGMGGGGGGVRRSAPPRNPKKNDDQ